MANRVLKFLLIFNLFLFNFTLHAEEATVPEFINLKLDAYIKEAIVSSHVPGLAISIVKNGEVILAQGYGTKQFDQKEDVDEHTLFILGSITKAFTATAIANLAHQKGFSLNDPIQKWLPPFELSDPWLNSHVTLQDLLSHRSGFGTYQGDFMFYDSNLSKSQIFQKLGELEPLNDFRTYGYTNIGYFLVGETIEAISGKSWENYLHDSFFKPLKMKHTLANPSKFNRVKNRAEAHTLKNGEISLSDVGDFSNMAAAGGIASSASDLSHWMAAQLENGQFEGNQIIAPEVISSTRNPQILVGQSTPPYTIFNNSNFQNYSSGWYHIDYEGLEIVTHNGGSYGYASSITLIPSLKLGVVILTNSDKHLLFETIKLEVVDAYLGLPFRNYSAIGRQFFASQLEHEAKDLEEKRALVQNAPTPRLSLGHYQGIYKNRAYGEITVTRAGDILGLGFQHHPNLKGTLEFIKEGEFLSTFNKPIYGNTIIQFKIDGNEITHMEFSVDGTVEPNTYSFVKYSDLDPH